MDRLSAMLSYKSGASLSLLSHLAVSCRLAPMTGRTGDAGTPTPVVSPAFHSVGGDGP